MRVRVKICGITRREDALAAVKSGTDAIGLVFYAPSPRAVTAQQAKAITEGLPPFVARVGLFVNASAEEVRAVMEEVHLDMLQFHGDETATFCEQFDVPYMKAIRVKHDTNLLQYAHTYAKASALLLDTYTEGVAGGTGKTFDWQLIPAQMPVPIVLAGGLDAKNVSAAVTQVKPYAVDVSGGVEISKGIKDAAKMAAFIQGVSNATV